jgi:glycosyltransferase involved in cell wall biosynthesis
MESTASRHVSSSSPTPDVDMPAGYSQPTDTHHGTAAPDAYLKANSAAYECLVERAAAADAYARPEEALRRVCNAALFAAKFHPGRFADGALENIAFDIGRRAASLAPEAAARTTKLRRVLHVVSHAPAVGGHTRMLHHWVTHDATSTHSLFIVDQGPAPVPEWLGASILKSRGTLTVCARRQGQLDKALHLRRLAHQHADLVVLHHDCCDVVPTVAFAVEGGPPVAIVDHADHLFWLGSSVADTVIALRSAGARHGAQRRHAPRNALLPIPLVPSQQTSRAQARSRLGIPPDQTVLLSVGRALKYRPCGAHDFVATANAILERNPSAHLYVVGVNLEGIRPYLRTQPHPALHFVGPVHDTSLHRAAADIYLESFPFGSNTALLEAALSGLPVVPAYAPLFPLLVAGNDSLNDLVSNPSSEEEYVSMASSLVRDRQQRIAFGAALRQRLLVEHVGEGWLRHLRQLYAHTDRLVHRPRLIPHTPCMLAEADVRLSLWNVMADGVTSHRHADLDSAHAALRHAAYVFKEAGDYARARGYAWQAARAQLNLATCRLVGATLLGRPGRTFRAWMRRTA